MLRSNSQCVSCCLWPADDCIITGSWDHSLKLWDPETGGITSTLHGNKVVTSLCAPNLAGTSLLATGKTR